MRNFAIASVAVLGLCLAACSPSAPAPTAETAEPAANTTAPATAETPAATMEAVIAHHVQTVKAADVEGTLSDYTNDAILVSPPGMMDPVGTFVGKDKVRAFFVWLAKPEILPGPQSMVTTNQIVGPNTLLFKWTQFQGTPQEVKGYDIFVFRGDKIAFQTTSANP
jgi:ketosteroid isomerase-like protein